MCAIFSNLSLKGFKTGGHSHSRSLTDNVPIRHITYDNSPVIETALILCRFVKSRKFSCPTCI